MKRILTSTALILFLALSGLLFVASPSGAADELIFDTFDNWKNPFVAEGWGTHSFGGWGGEYNQIYEAGQEMTSLQGDSSYYRSVYKDFAATPGKYYSVSFEPIEGNWLNYLGDLGLNRVWIQFDDKNGNVLATYGGQAGIEHGGEKTYYVPGEWQGVSYPKLGQRNRRRLALAVSRSLRSYARIATTMNWWVRQGALAPAGTDHMRVVFQVLAKQGTAAFRKVTVYEAVPTGESNWGRRFAFTPIGGPFISRNTEFVGGIANGWSPFTFGSFPGEYKIRPAGGSSQGISSGGTFGSYRSIYRDLKVTPGVKYKTTVDVISNSTNEIGTRTPSPVRVWVQYNGLGYIQNPMGYGDKVLSTHGIDGTQAGIKDNEWTTVTVPGNGNAPYTVAPEGATRARIILQVMGGTGGGTVFDNVSFTRAEG